jgi:hypothetical protein
MGGSWSCSLRFAVRSNDTSRLLLRPRLSDRSLEKLAWLLTIVLVPPLVWAVHAWRTEHALNDGSAAGNTLAAEPLAAAAGLRCIEYGAAVPTASMLIADIQRAAPAARLEAQFTPSLREPAAAAELGVALTLQAPYPVIKAVAGEVLARYPTSALLTLDIRREPQQPAGDLDARLALVFWGAAGGTARCQGRKQPS